MNQKNTNKPKLSNNIKNIANKGSSALQQVKDKVVETANSLKKTTNKAVENVKEKVDNVTKKVTNKAQESESITKLTSMTQEFFNSNSAISKFVGFFLCLLLFIILFQIGMGILLKIFGPSYNPYLINGMVRANNETIVSTNPNIKDSVPLYRSIDQPQGIEFTWNVWFVINKINSTTSNTPNLSYTIFSKGKNNNINNRQLTDSEIAANISSKEENVTNKKRDYNAEAIRFNDGTKYINELQTTLDSTKTAKDTAYTNRETARNAFTSALPSDPQRSAKETAKNNAETAYTSAQTAYNTALTALTSAQSQFNGVKIAFDTAKTAYDNAILELKNSKINYKYLKVSPGVFVKKNTDSYNLEVVLNTFDTSNNMPYETIVINNVPIEKWVCCTVRVQGIAVDVYINGMLKKRLNLKNIPKQNYEDVYIGEKNGGISGYVSSLRYYNYAIGYNEIQSLFTAGPSLKMLANDEMPAGLNDYLSNNWYFDNTAYTATG